jgi:hypothetical protein
MELRVLDEQLAIARCAANDPVPAWVRGRDLLVVIRTQRELSIVCADDAVPARHSEVERGFRAIAVAGTLDFALTGIVARLAQPLADAGISIFGISTYDTDHILVRENTLPAARTALESAGHTFV